MNEAAEDPRSCKRPARQFGGDGYRPSDMLASFFFAAIALFVAGAVAGMLTALDAVGDDGRWIAIHLILLGGVSQLILGAAQFFSTAYLATDPPSSKMIRAQLIVWNLGVLLVVASVPSGVLPLVDAGAVLIVSGLALFVRALRSLEARSLQTARWAIRWYYACAALLSVGVLLGAVLTHGVVWTNGDLLTAHLALNIAGWLGTAIVGTLHTFFPSLTHGLLRHPRLQGPTFVSWVLGVVVLASGAAFDVRPLIVVGWSSLAIASVLLSVNIVSSAITAEPPISLAARLVGTAQVFLPVGMFVALAMVVVDGPSVSIVGEWRIALAALLGIGWVGMTVAGSMIHLLAVLNRVRNFLIKMPEPHPVRDTAIAATLATSIGALALSAFDAFAWVAPFATVALIVMALPVLYEIASLAAKAVSLAPWFRPLRSDR